tara:strand:- start:492 stop:716 length:225 start_codon:yes stop_codon:yes gene_type:complete
MEQNMTSRDQFPQQPQLIFQGNATPEEQQEWIEGQGSYEETVNTVLTTIILGSIFQFSTFGMMILAFYLIDKGL